MLRERVAPQSEVIGAIVWEDSPCCEGCPHRRRCRSVWRRTGALEADTTLAVGESSVILLHLPLPSVGVSIAMQRERQHNGRLADVGSPPRGDLVGVRPPIVRNDARQAEI